jgi:competence protein ComEA
MRKLKSCIAPIAVLLLILVWLPALWAEESQKININTALAEELMNLKGVGVKKAKAIIEFRESNGPFKTPEDLIRVPGIGPKTFEANKNRIIVE